MTDERIESEKRPCDDAPPLTREEETLLLDLARRAIASEWRSDDPTPPIRTESEPLQRPSATFVTLRKSGQLRGCIGSLESNRPLHDSVWTNARSAAFRDPRFPPLEPDELSAIQIEISLLSPLAPIPFDSEEDLLTTLRPGTDGLLIEDDNKRATFLPSVWESLPTPHQFLDELRQKAGIQKPLGPTSKAWRYTSHTW